jgi:hypothetical protein
MMETAAAAAAAAAAAVIFLQMVAAVADANDNDVRFIPKCCNCKR